MSIAPIDSIANLVSAAPSLASQASGVEVSFESLLNGLQSLNTRAVADEQAVASFAAGKTDNLQQVMLDIERTRLGFELMLAVRTKVLDAYQEMMRMQV